MSYQTILVEIKNRVGFVTLNRPAVLNALNDQMIDELGQALVEFDANEQVSVVLLMGGEKAFAAGADITAMASCSFAEVFKSNLISRNWDIIKAIRKPIIAAVSGFALGGGCELVMMCDIVVASETAKFGQPEVKLGILPGAGGTQRLPRAVGKAKAMDFCLTGRLFSAEEAERIGLVSRVFPDDKYLEEAFEIAKQIAQYSLPALLMIKESINRAYETSLNEGLIFERRLFHSAFAMEDQKEGMQAFIEKRKPLFRGC